MGAVGAEMFGLAWMEDARWLSLVSMANKYCEFHRYFVLVLSRTRKDEEVLKMKG